MAELILTEEEKAAPTYLEWSDEVLGQAVRQEALKLQDQHGTESMIGVTGAHLLVGLAITANATKSIHTLEDVITRGKPTGDWRITVEKIRNPAKEEDL